MTIHLPNSSCKDFVVPCVMRKKQQLANGHLDKSWTNLASPKPSARGDKEPAYESREYAEQGHRLKNELATFDQV